MKSIEIKDEGSYWKLLTLWGSERMPNNGCSLLWRTAFHSVLIVGGCALIGAFLGSLVANIVAMIVTQTWIWGFSLGLLAVTVAMIAVLFAVATPFIVFSEAKEESTNPVMKSIYNVKTIHKGFKDKFCPSVEVVEK